MNKMSFWEFIRDNADGLVAALVVAFSAATLSAFMRGLSTLSVALSLLAAFILVAIATPMAALYWGLPWPMWLLIGGVAGVAGLSIMWGVIKFFERIQNRAGDIADRAVDRVMPGKDRPAGDP